MKILEKPELKLMHMNYWDTFRTQSNLSLRAWIQKGTSNLFHFNVFRSKKQIWDKVFCECQGQEKSEYFDQHFQNICPKAGMLLFDDRVSALNVNGKLFILDDAI